MVKGVNKQIIEINDTGNSYFERVLLFVAPGKSDVPVEELKSEAKSYLLNLSSDFKPNGLREQYGRKKKRKLIALSCLVSAVVLSAITVFILNIV